MKSCRSNWFRAYISWRRADKEGVPIHRLRIMQWAVYPTDIEGRFLRMRKARRLIFGFLLQQAKCALC